MAPGWASVFAYAEQFGVDPQTVPSTVSLLTWERWKTLEKAKASRQLWRAWLTSNGKAVAHFSQSETELWHWGILKDKR